MPIEMHGLNLRVKTWVLPSKENGAMIDAWSVANARESSGGVSAEGTEGTGSGDYTDVSVSESGWNGSDCGDGSDETSGARVVHTLIDL